MQPPSPLTYQDLVTELYRGILGREPDSGGLADHSASLARGMKLADLLQAFVASEEFAARHRAPDQPAGAQVPHFNLEPPTRIDVIATPDQAARLWAHIGAIWATLGQEDPYWSVLTSPRWRMPMMSDAAVLDAFYASGAGDIERITAWLARHGRTVDGTVCAEYGCGVGRMTLWLAQRCRHVHAFDISPTHIARAEQRLRAEGITNVTFHLVRGPADLLAMQGVDLFVSFIVLQHNPPPIMALILRNAFHALSPGGAAMFQVPTYPMGHSYRFDLAAYLDWMPQSTGIEMHALPQHHVFTAAARHGMTVLEVQQDGLAGPGWASHTFLLAKK
jgi:SAM-dependent methyltransferase